MNPFHPNYKSQLVGFTKQLQRNDGLSKLATKTHGAGLGAVPARASINTSTPAQKPASGLFASI